MKTELRRGLNSNEIKLIAILMDKVYGLLQLGTLLSLPILSCYNGARGNCRQMKWVFYLYYPAHLFVIGLIRVLTDLGQLFP